MGCGCSTKETGLKTRRTIYANNPRKHQMSARQHLRRMRVENAARHYLRQAPIFNILTTYRKDSANSHLSVTIFSYLSFPEAVRISGVSREFYKLTGSKQILSLYGGAVVRDTQRSAPRFGANILIINTNQVFLNRGDSQVVQLVSPTYVDNRDILDRGDHVQFENQFFRKSLLSLGRSSLNTAQFYGHENEFASNKVAKRIGGLSIRSGEGLTSIVSSLDIANISTPKSNPRRGSKFSGKSGGDEQYHSEQSLRGKTTPIADSSLSFRFDLKHCEERNSQQRRSQHSRFAFENSPRQLPQFAGLEEDKEY